MQSTSTLKERPANIPIVLDNAMCPYCGIKLDLKNSTREHVIGRSFVPRGQLNGQWNLILRACTRCNREKADLEDDISAITMQPDAWGRHATNDSTLTMEAKRKGQGSISRKTAKRVKQSPESLNIRLALGANASMTLDLTCPPQLKDERVIRLCVLHSLAFFFLITYDPHSAQGKVWPGKFLPVHWVFKGDWGNPVHTAFANAVVSWSTRVLGIAANGFFRVVMRKHPAKLCWSWAYEWNQNVRIIGFFGETEVAQQIAATFPSLGGFLWENGNQFTRIREEIALAESEEDNLFVVTN